MDNICSGSISNLFDYIFSRFLHCTIRKAAYISGLERNLDALQTELQKLLEARNDVMRRVSIAEQRQMKRRDQVQGWLSRVEAVDAEVGELQMVKSREIERLCLGGYCSQNFNSSYKFGRKVSKLLPVLAGLKAEGAFFEVVAERVPENVVDEIPVEPTIIGLQSTLDKVWRCLREEQVGIIGLYGIGGVGKTTLLKQINNNFCNQPHGFDVVIWLVVSKEPKYEKIQEDIGKKIGLLDESWKNCCLHEKARDIFKILSKKKFVILFDDIWDRVDLAEIGVPFPSLENASTIVFTTREFEVCGRMEAHKSFRVGCLGHDDAWKLFQEKLGRGILDSHYDIPELAKIITRECGGLPLALVTVGRSMSCKKSPREWKHAIEVLRKSASKFSGMGKRVYSRLKFSYDNLPSDLARSCLLYCSLFPEDYRISKNELVDCWIGEGFLDEYDGSEVQNQGYYIIGVLVDACLLEEEERGEYYVKMHDVIRDMALWIACETEKENENFLVQAGMGLTESPAIEKWKGIRRMSLMENKIENLTEAPTCSNLETLFLNNNSLKMITSDFFQFMPSLKVLSLSNNRSLTKLPSGISKLVSLQYLDLSWTSIKELPMELKALVNLKCLGLEHMDSLEKIPRKLICNFSKLRVLKMFGLRGYSGHIAKDSILFGDGEFLVEELLSLKYLNVLTITLRSSHALQKFLSSVKLQSYTQSLSLQCFDDSKLLNVFALADLKHLHKLYFYNCEYSEVLKIEHVPEALKHYGFHSLDTVLISFCSKLRDLTWLVFVPNLKFLYVFRCDNIEEIVNVVKLGEILQMMANISPFAKLQSLDLCYLPNVKSIYREPLPFQNLKEIYVQKCPELKKLPLNSNSAREGKLVIIGEEHWWKELQWEDEATQNAFLPCFESLD